MPKIEKKQLVVNEIKAKLEGASSMVLIDARGLTVAQDTALRKKLRDAGVAYKVYKNTMVNFAIEGTEFESIKEHLNGPTAVAVSYEDPAAAARIIKKELKAMPKLEFKAGVVEGKYYDVAGLNAVAEVPSKAELLSKLLGSFKSPIASFARVVNAIAEKDPNAVVAEKAEELVAVADEPAAE